MATVATQKDPKPASLGQLDPFARLAAGVVVQSLADLRSPDPVIALDSLGWWLDPAGAATWLDALDLSAGADPNKAFMLAVKGASRGKTDPTGKPREAA